MATKKKVVVPKDEQLENQNLDLFEVLAAMDRKDYGYYDRLSDEQKKKFAPYVLVQWMSSIKANSGLSAYYLMNTDYMANKHLLNEHVSKNPKLQWLMLCAASPGMGKQFHQWIPNISVKVSKLQENAKLKDIKDYYTKIYPKANSEDIQAVSEAFVDVHKKKMFLAERYPHMKFEDIELLAEMITYEDIEQYKRDSGN